MDNKINKHIINAPAGSGKTTEIRRKLEFLCLKQEKCKVLCITYTNRAVEELKKDIYNKNIEIYTIHTFINKLISPFFKEPKIIDLYFQVFEEKIKAKLESTDEKDLSSKQKYCDKYNIDSLNIFLIKENLLEISYGEIPFTSLFYGKLSHDDLLIFANEICKKYPNVLKKIYTKYDYIFIDEYQDTPTPILNIFNTAADINSNLQLFLFGDRMQQIYPNYDGSFEDEFEKYTEEKLKTNYRSNNAIIKILNNIYNDKNFKQIVYEKNKNVEPDINPKFVITENQNEVIKKYENSLDNHITLYLMNKEKFAEIGCLNLYIAYDQMEAYKFGNKYKAVDILSDITTENPDGLFSLLIAIYNIIDLYYNSNYGMIISLFKTKSKFYNISKLKMSKNSDKIEIKNILQKCYNVSTNKDSTIEDVINIFQNQNLLNENLFNSIISNKDYENVLKVKFKEFCNDINYLNKPTLSTQHGVKGESHQSVIFATNESTNNPNVRMYLFFKMWSNLNFSLPEIEDFYYKIKKDFLKIKKLINYKTNDFKLKDYEYNKLTIDKYCNNTFNKYKENIFFKTLYIEKFKKYLANPNRKNATNILSISEIEGVLFAFKIFYVGCSRARRNLIIVCDKNKILDFNEQFESKLNSIGFNVEYE